MAEAFGAGDSRITKSEQLDLNLRKWLLYYLVQAIQNLPDILYALLLQSFTLVIPLYLMNGSILAGGQRPVQVHLPSGFNLLRNNDPAPLIIGIHGFNATPSFLESLIQLKDVAQDNGFIYMLPLGIKNTIGARFWKATDACCDFADMGRDDSFYLSSLIKEVKRRVSVDPRRVYIIGHSNGGFMAHRLACEHSS